VIVDSFIASLKVTVGVVDIETLVDHAIGVTEVTVGAVVSHASSATTSYVNACSNELLLELSVT